MDNQPQSNTFLVPTDAEKRGDFSALTRNGAPFYIKDPMSTLACSQTAGGPGCFSGNIIPSNRINPVGQKLAGYYPTPDSQVDTGASNFSMTDLLPSQAYQWSTKIDHHFNNAVALNGFVLRQVTHEANANYNPTNRFVGGSYQLDRTINTVVVNNTYIINPSTVLTLRGGYNKFNDNYNLPQAFDAAALFNNPSFTNQMSDTNRFPTLAITGYKSAGWTNRQTNGYYQYGANGTLSKLAGTHNFKMGGDYRVLGVQSLNYGASTGSYTFTGVYSGNALADMILGYPQSGNIPLAKPLDGYVNYYSGYVQDDWRVSDRLTINYGLRLERETGLAERDNQITVGFDQNAVSPLNSLVNVTDPLTGQRRTIMGGLIFAGQDGAPTHQGNQPAIKAAPRAGMVYSFDEKTVVRGGWGLYYAPWNYPAAGTTAWGQMGFAATTNIQTLTTTPTATIDNPFPAGLTQPSGSNQGLLTGVSNDITFIDPNKGAPHVQQVLGGPAARDRSWHDGHGRLHGTQGLQSRLGRHHGHVDQHQSDRSEVPVAGGEHDDAGGESVLRRGGGRRVRDAGDGPARTAAAAVPAVPERQHESEHGRALAVPRGDLSAAEARDGVLGRQLQLHLQPLE